MRAAGGEHLLLPAQTQLGHFGVLHWMAKKGPAAGTRGTPGFACLRPFSKMAAVPGKMDRSFLIA